MSDLETIGSVFIAFRETDLALFGLDKAERKESASTYEEARSKSKVQNQDWVWFEFSVDSAGNRFDPKKIGVIDNA